ncbi:tetratricopeptide repeat protein [Desulfohalobium retbaense]|uniref:Tetratricopeptide TPR_2 repeat protein n=1 Tax=Desulfohalobium retbaense (strain ATCC 49708 / DSM 5692 / JCM 16813 / HR100) TaxID=485915 RepID=C8X150_DESRD|nr:tetratricopeptide repeat protein [Desulfohalobium retbaense]ACV68147.1 Tetratricopeptide TPR_2 repeat protein [Desulfohalobium retbaense DSM 5692]
MPRMLRFVLAFLALVCVGCTPRSAPDLTPPAQWQLSPAARTDFLFLKAQALLAEGNAPAAAQALSRALEEDPQPTLYLELAETYWRNEERQKAKTILKEATERFPDQFAFVANLAQIYMAGQRPKAAAATLRSYIQDHPDNWTARAKLGEIQVRIQAFADAVDTLQTIPEPEREPEHLFFLGQAQAGLGLLQKASDNLQSAVDKAPQMAKAWAELGYIRERQKDYPAAITAYTRLSELQPDNQEVLIRLIELHLELNNPDKAQTLAESGPGTESFRLRCVDVFLQNGFYTPARAMLDTIRESADFSPKTYLYEALYWYQKERNPARAIEALRQIPASAPFYNQSLHFLGQMHLERDQPEQAVQVARKGKATFPDIPDFWLLHSNALRRQDKPQKALEVINDALEKWPEDTDLLYQKGLLAEALDQSDTAMASMEQIISLDPEHADALNFVGYSLAEQGRELDRALVLIKNAVELRPENGYILDSLAWVYYQKGNYAKAWDIIQEAVQLSTEDPTIWEHYGDIAAKLQKTKEARRGYRKAIELGAEDQTSIDKKLQTLPEPAPL